MYHLGAIKPIASFTTCQPSAAKIWSWHAFTFIPLARPTRWMWSTVLKPLPMVPRSRLYTYAIRTKLSLSVFFFLTLLHNDARNTRKKKNVRALSFHGTRSCFQSGVTWDSRICASLNEVGRADSFLLFNLALTTRTPEPARKLPRMQNHCNKIFSSVLSSSAERDRTRI